MNKPLATQPTIQVLERMFSLLDVLASFQDPVSLKTISEKTGFIRRRRTASSTTWPSAASSIGRKWGATGSA